MSEPLPIAGEPVDDAYTVTGRVLAALGRLRAQQRERPGGELPAGPTTAHALELLVCRGLDDVPTPDQLLQLGAIIVRMLEPTIGSRR